MPSSSCHEGIEKRHSSTTVAALQDDLPDFDDQEAGQIPPRERGVRVCVCVCVCVCALL